MVLKEHNKILRILKMIQYLSAYPPKSVSRLENLLDVSKATVYRYFILLKEIGYHISCDENNLYFISEADSIHRFNKDEKKVIVTALKANPEMDVMTKSIIHKLQIKDVLPDPANLTALHRIRMLNNIQKAIISKSPLLILQYSGTDSGAEPKDRRVIPFEVNEYNMSVTAWDMDKQAFRIFKVYRMDDVELLDSDPDSLNSIPPPEVDIFGMSGYDYSKVSLLLSVRAEAILKEEFYRANIDISDYGGKAGYPYRLDIKVCGYEGIGRFVLGLLSEIIILGDKGFRDYIRKKLNSATVLTN